MTRILLALLVCLSGSASLTAAERQTPNIVIFLVDDMGVMDTSVPFLTDAAGASFGAPASYYGAANYGNEGGKVPKTASHAVPHLEKYHGSDTFLTEALTIEANAQVSAAAKAGQPFFLNFAHYAVHAPFNSDPRFAPNYRDSGESAQAQAFATLIEGMDKSLGDLLEHLETLGVAENTLVFFLGDNGSDYWTSYRDGRWKVIYHYVPSAASENSHYQLFDLTADPFEQHNLAASHPDDLRRMMRSLIVALESHKAVYPLNDDLTSRRKPEPPE